MHYTRTLVFDLFWTHLFHPKMRRFQDSLEYARWTLAKNAFKRYNWYLPRCSPISLEKNHLRQIFEPWVILRNPTLARAQSVIPQRLWPFEAYFRAVLGTDKSTIWVLMVQKHHMWCPRSFLNPFTFHPLLTRFRCQNGPFSRLWVLHKDISRTKSGY